MSSSSSSSAPATLGAGTPSASSPPLPAPPSTISSLGQQFAQTLFGPSSSRVGPPAQLISSPNKATRDAKGKGRVVDQDVPMADASEEDEIEDDEVMKDLLSKQDDVSPSPVKPSAPFLRASLHPSVGSATPPGTPTRRAVKKEPSDSILVSPAKDPLPAVKREASDTIHSSPRRSPLVVKDEILDAPLPKLEPQLDSIAHSSPSKPALPNDGPPSSAPARRTPEEIAALRLVAQTKLKATQQKKAREATQLRYEDLASRSLGEFGFIAQTGTTRVGTGKGGDGVVPTEEWKPDERCSEEQRAVLESVKGGENFFFTGSAGVGKSFLLTEITRLLTSKARPYQVTATTGIAALQVSGTTLHSWAGVGLGNKPVLELFDKMTKLQRQVWVNTQTLIIDEISMIDPVLFTKLNILGKIIRQNPRPFGGLQLVVSGDFFQLPPVPEKHPTCIRCGLESLALIPPAESRLPHEEAYCQLRIANPTRSREPVEVVVEAEIWKCCDIKRNGEKFVGCGLEVRARRFAFETESWAECNFKVMELTKVFRQSDPDFITMLEKFRRGHCDQTSIDLLNGCGTNLRKLESIKPTNLYPLRRSVDAENSNEFSRLQQKAYNFVADDTARGDRGEYVKVNRLKDVPAPPLVQLKIGAQVLLLANLSLEQGLVNGSRGVIVDWRPASEAPKRGNTPPPLGGKVRKGGGWGTEEWRAKAAEDFMLKQKEQVLPMVFFACGITMIVEPWAWVLDVDKDNAVARTQLPLALGWALTIHKSQGQSLDAVGVKLTNTFERGQAYVALSRCRTPAGMLVEGFRAGHIMAHPTVAQFYNNIASSQSFINTPARRINPLVYIPEFSPLLHKLQRIFGPVPALLPAGSALPPGHVSPAGSLPPSLDQQPPKAVFAVFQPPIPAPAIVPQLLPIANPAAIAWEALLRQSAAAFVANGSSDITLFIEQARQLIASAVVVPVPMEEDEGQETETETVVGGISREVSVASVGEGEGEGRKKKRKRRRRVGG